MNKISLFELNAVAAVAYHRNFRLAAARFGVSPSSLSHAIASLEERLGVRLFHRTTRAVSMTEAGEQFLVRIRPALQQIDDAVEFVNQAHQAPRGVLRINATLGGGASLLSQVIEEFLRRYPDMSVDLAVDDNVDDITANGFDAGVRPLESVPRDMVAVLCSPRGRRAVVGSPEYFSRHPIPLVPEDLLQHRCIRWHMPDGHAAPWGFSKDGQTRLVEVSGNLTLDNPCLMVEAAEAGMGLAKVSEWALDHRIADGRLVRVLEDWVPSHPGLYFYYPGHRHVPARLQCFVDVIRAVMATLPAGAAGRG